MLFNSLDFAVFFPVVFVLYWFIVNKNLKIQNLFIVIASYVFYGWWNWRFLFLIFFSTLIDYAVGLGLSGQTDERKRKGILSISIIVNLLFLGIFKYYNFFADSFVSAFSFLGMKITAHHLNIVLPVGISFYTFQTMSYSIDIYKRKLEPTGDFIAFAAFVSFFPQLVAGPIERAARFLPQFYKARVFEYDKAVDGCWQILWGLFKKMVVADNCAVLANEIFKNYGKYSGSTLVLGAVFFTFQIYGDFSGYSDIAIGIARLFGFNLMRNFAFPYFSRDIAEFWRRWHISLTSWFRDYVYIPLGGSRRGKLISVRNTFTVFLLSGLWHGANGTFVVWGALNALCFLPLLLLGKNRVNLEWATGGGRLSGLKEFCSVVITFCFIVTGWIFFRAETIGHALKYFAGICSPSLFSIPRFTMAKMDFGSAIMSIFILLVVEWINRESAFGLSRPVQNRVIRWIGYIILVFLIAELGGSQQEFIYFQF